MTDMATAACMADHFDKIQKVSSVDIIHILRQKEIKIPRSHPSVAGPYSRMSQLPPSSRIQGLLLRSAHTARL